MPARLRTFWAANPFQGQYSEEEVGPCGCGDVKMCFLHLHYFWNRLNLFVSDSDNLHWVCRGLGELSLALTKHVIPSTAELSVEKSIQHVAFRFWHFLLAPRITQHIPLVLMNHPPPQTIALDARSQKRLLHLHVSRFTFEVAKQCQFGCCLELFKSQTTVFGSSTLFWHGSLETLHASFQIIPYPWNPGSCNTCT